MSSRKSGQTRKSAPTKKYLVLDAQIYIVRDQAETRYEWRVFLYNYSISVWETQLGKTKNLLVMNECAYIAYKI